MAYPESILHHNLKTMNYKPYAFNSAGIAVCDCHVASLLLMMESGNYPVFNQEIYTLTTELCYEINNCNTF